MFRLIVFTIIAVFEFRSYRAARKHFGPAAGRYTGYRIFTACMLLFGVPLVVMLLFNVAPSDPPAWFIVAGVYPFYIWHFSLTLLGLGAAILDLLLLPYRVFRWLRWKLAPSAAPALPYNPGRRRALRQGLVLVAATTVGSSAIGAMRKNAFEVTRTTLTVPGLPPAFDGFSVALLTDIHSSIFMTRRMMDEYAGCINGLGCDLILVTGDFVNSHADEVYPCAEAFSVLKAPFGVYGVLGNHDYYTRQVDRVAREVDAAGIRLLVDDRTELIKQGETIHLLGLDDIGTTARAEASLASVTRGLPPGGARLLMCHRPYFFPQAAAHGVGLMLSGHTHGGQIVLGQFGRNVIAPARIASEYVAGPYAIGPSNMYVSRGIGTVGVPIRFNCPPEIAVLTLARDA